MKKIVLAAILCILCACGRKDDPLPKTNIEVPLPEVQIELTEEGVLIANLSDEYIVVVERAESEIGDIGFPRYSLIARIQPSESFIDGEIDKNKRYLYRFRSYYFRYNIYSGYVTQAVSYRGAVELLSVDWRLAGEDICLTMEASPATASVEVRVNGVSVGYYTSGEKCYTLPPTANILLMVIPHSESGAAGTVFSENITRDTSDVLLPPQNVRLLRRGTAVTLSWDPVPEATGYRIRGNGWTRDIRATQTLIAVPVASSECTFLAISTLRNGRESQKMNIESCP